MMKFNVSCTHGSGLSLTIWYTNIYDRERSSLPSKYKTLISRLPEKRAFPKSQSFMWTVSPEGSPLSMSQVPEKPQRWNTLKRETDKGPICDLLFEIKIFYINRDQFQTFVNIFTRNSFL